MPTTFPTTQTSNIEITPLMLVIVGVVVVAFLILVAKSRRPVTRPVPVVQTAAGAAAVVGVLVEPIHQPGTPDEAIALGDLAMSQLATAWKTIKASYNAILEQKKTLELDRDHYKQLNEQAAATVADLQRQLEAAKSVAEKFDPADLAAVEEIIASGSPRTPATPAAPATGSPVPDAPVDEIETTKGGDV